MEKRLRLLNPSIIELYRLELGVAQQGRTVLTPIQSFEETMMNFSGIEEYKSNILPSLTEKLGEVGASNVSMKDSRFSHINVSNIEAPAIAAQTHASTAHNPPILPPQPTPTQEYSHAHPQRQIAPQTSAAPTFAESSLYPSNAYTAQSFTPPPGPSTSAASFAPQQQQTYPTPAAARPLIQQPPQQQHTPPNPTKQPAADFGFDVYPPPTTNTQPTFDPRINVHSPQNFEFSGVQAVQVKPAEPKGRSSVGNGSAGGDSRSHSDYSNPHTPGKKTVGAFSGFGGPDLLGGDDKIFDSYRQSTGAQQPAQMDIFSMVPPAKQPAAEPKKSADLGFDEFESTFARNQPNSALSTNQVPRSVVTQTQVAPAPLAAEVKSAFVADPPSLDTSADPFGGFAFPGWQDESSIATARPEAPNPNTSAFSSNADFWGASNAKDDLDDFQFKKAAPQASVQPAKKAPVFNGGDFFGTKSTQNAPPTMEFDFSRGKQQPQAQPQPVSTNLDLFGGAFSAPEGPPAPAAQTHSMLAFDLEPVAPQPTVVPQQPKAAPVADRYSAFDDILSGPSGGSMLNVQQPANLMPNAAFGSGMNFNMGIPGFEAPQFTQNHMNQVQQPANVNQTDPAAAAPKKRPEDDGKFAGLDAFLFN